MRRFLPTSRFMPWLAPLLLAPICFARGQDGGTAEPVFERDVLPLLTERCVKCHGGEKPKGKLDLRSKSTMLKGGESGSALVPGAADKSLLFEMVSKGEMPPKKETKLTAAEIARIRTWIDRGAPVLEAHAEHSDTAAGMVTEQDRKFWSFQKPVRPPVPPVRHADRVRTPIDAFILAKLEGKGLSLSPDAEPATLVRRLFIDLLGLPPSPDDVEEFVTDARPDAYERLVDRLLASPHYGERWGRHWLDAAGYADTVGGDNDPGQVFLRQGMWRYRDYVIRSLNDDKPYDRFLKEQIAGDEMDNWQSAPTLTPVMLEHLTATGFLRTSVDHTTEMELNRPFERFQVLHDTIENLTSNVLGLTVACARCHDHKFDPIPQVEYYRLMACLKPAYNPEAWIQPQDRHRDDISTAEREQMDRQNAEIDRRVTELQRRIAGLREPVERRLVDAKLATLPECLRGDVRTAIGTEVGKRSEVQKYLADKLGPLVKVSAEEVTNALREGERAAADGFAKEIAGLNAQRRSCAKVQALWESEDKPPPATHLLRRGNHLTPGPEVQPGVFSVLTEVGTSPLIPPPAPGAKSSGRRTAWARWLTRPDHPLTARVFVNRVWQNHFGEGIIATADNFGHLGTPPTHPELLDWLATEFVRSDWSMKALHRLVVTSSVYRQASFREEPLAPAEANPETVDPGNQLLWRMRLRRVESEVVRDSVLAVSSKLDRTMGGPPVPIDPRPDGLVVVAGAGLPSPTAPLRRSLYLLARRNYNLTLLSVFDQPVMATNCTRRIASAVPLQSLTLLNDATMLEQADAFAARVAACAGESRFARIEFAFRVAFGRTPRPSEVAAGIALIEKVKQRCTEQKMTPEQAEQKALAKFCHMLLCANEFLYVG